MLWQDKRQVNLISTMHDTTEAESGKVNRATNEPILKPKLILEYNKNMGGVDCSDMVTNSYAAMRKSVKWYKKLVFHLSDLSLTNAFILYKWITGNATMRHLTFTQAVIKALLETSCDDRPLPQRSGRSSTDCVSRLQYKSSRHWPSLIVAVEGAKKRLPTRICAVCAARSKRSETRYECSTCNAPLHPDNCFEVYHTKYKLSQ